EVAPRSSSPGPAATAPSTAPAGLYSPISGLGWESYLNDRLDAELARSASFEQDLSLLVFAYEGLSPGSAEYGLVAKAIADFFSFKDLSFERGPEGFAIVLPNIDADHGLRMAEEFLKKLAGLFKEGSEPLAAPPAFIGLSSRAGRLVDAARVTQEAEAALKKAREDRDSHIVAFRPDPDKYRLYLASKGC
ncbi:MAG: GGDEF domain-containing protein, partial [Spirochaetaceae bacterium]|nr:GGDEF domain-containing protein [Spirochaetaceae bacterium]